ncbi:S49 family peptidase [Zobellella sp. DQSA1]|uniref:S49 family peptidase n=1 Tax=Zobellella sp. DQSA1 TaxID=3342386 RepID=UPI0035C0014B
MPQLINYPHVAAQVFDVPLYATRTALDAVKSVLVPRLMGRGSTIELPQALTASAPEVLANSGQGRVEQFDGMHIVGKIAVIKVHGLLVARRGHITQACTELMSYELVRSNIALALAHDLVEEIVLDLNSGGGMAVGCKELADYIYQARQQKPITAIVNFYAYSACYFVAAACSRIVVSTTSGVGSIGVLLEHMELSRWEQEVGLTFTTFYRGERKNDGSPHEPLTEGATAAIDQRLDEAYQLFTESVAEYRGLKVQAVIDTQARLMSAAEAIAAGFADELMSPDQAINAIASKYQTPPPRRSIQARAAAIDLSCKL